MKLLAAVLALWLAALTLVLLLVLDEPETSCKVVESSTTPPLPAGSRVSPMKSGTYTLTSGFGVRGGGEFHQGVDMAAAAGTPIYAAADGKVIDAGPASGFGSWVRIAHNIDGAEIITVYGHMFPDDISVTVGESVRAGQQIALVGYNGQVDPPGPQGAHLHFETRRGGTAEDPATWLATAGEPGAPTAPSTLPPDSSSPDPQSVPDTAVAEGGLAPLPPQVGSEEHLQPNAVRLARTILTRFPQITRIGGWRASDPFPDHPDGRAIDVMIPDYASGEGKALGDAVADYAITQAPYLRVEYIIWRGVYRPATGEPSPNFDPDAGDTANHFDHVHITVTTGDPADGPVAATAPATNGGVPGCGPERGGGSVDDDLAPGSVPAEYEQWYRQAGTLCPQIKPSLLAAQGHAESGFNPQAGSGAGALGIAQFLPGTAAANNPDDGRPYVLDSDGNGTASVWDPGDAIIGQGRYMCAIANKVDAWIADGSVSAPNGATELYLAAYNAGEGAVLSSGGFPTGATDYQVQTRPYVDKILATAPQYSNQLD
ncbi:M23 family metallopeptidase (plasmid) [Nocardia sp. NBC_01377]|uniref:M23 family metallopeptidase n=1 Tax=Nocardia sp. NBC_01377 TaxID=2903595 RepID=UPI002F908751